MALPHDSVVTIILSFPVALIKQPNKSNPRKEGFFEFPVQGKVPCDSQDRGSLQQLGHFTLACQKKKAMSAAAA